MTMTDPYKTIGKRNQITDQRTKARPDQVENNAGGFVFQVSDAEALRRFLILGTDAGTYYANAKDHTTQAAAVVTKMADAGDPALLSTILDVSLNGLAPRQSATLVALAAACASPDDKLRAEALAAVPKVCRTFTMLAEFLDYVKTFRGMGRGLRNAVGNFYTDKTADQVALQAIKYRQRNGWTHSDVLRVAHPASPTPEHAAIYDYVSDRKSEQNLPRLIEAFEQINADGVTAKQAAELIIDTRLPWEAVPDSLLNDKAVLEALVPSMGATALLRQLPRLARAGVTDGHFGGAEVVAKLTDLEFVQRGRLHPYNVLVALMTYRQGHSTKGSSTWTPSRMIIDALAQTYELSFKAITPAGKRTGIFLDVSGSMSYDSIKDSPINAREGSAAMAMATVRTEPAYVVGAFTGGGWGGRNQQLENISVLDIEKKDSLNSVIRKISGLPFGGTDCALPMLWALKNEPTIETFIIYTDNETWAGSIHPHQALCEYRRKTGIDAKLIVAGMTATNFTIADPTDRGMLDCVGFDSSAPALIADFSAGRI